MRVMGGGEFIIDKLVRMDGEWRMEKLVRIACP